jgi:hypothetical protein
MDERKNRQILEQAVHQTNIYFEHTMFHILT